MEVFNKIGDKPYIIVINKMDIGDAIDKERLEDKLGDTDVIYVSAKENKNIVGLEDKIFEFVGINELGRRETVLSNERHVEAIREARRHLVEAVEPLEDHMPIDLVATDIRDAWHALGEVTGETVDEEIVERIFAKFCVGK
jgi:tRNA modification GTPase